MLAIKQKEIDRAACERLRIEWMRTECMSMGWDKDKSYAALDRYSQSCVEFQETYRETWEGKRL